MVGLKSTDLILIEMHIYFSTVRIGNKRKNAIKEKILLENYNYLKKELTSFLKAQELNQEINLVLVIPSKGYKIRFTINGIEDKNIKRLLKTNFPKYIFNNDYSILIANSLNPTYLTPCF